MRRSGSVRPATSGTAWPGRASRASSRSSSRPRTTGSDGSKHMRAAVIDVGSNSIKLLVADKRRDGRLAEVASRTIEARISAGIGSRLPYLSPEGIARGIAAIAELNGEAERAGAAKATAVATSAVRGASNGPEFAYE